MIITNEQDAQRLSILEGQAPKLMSRVTNDDFAIVVATDVRSVDATILNVFTGEYVLEQEALTVADVFLDDEETHSYKETPDGPTLTIDCTFIWKTESSYFITTGDDAEYRVEIWAVPFIGERLNVGVWKVSVKHSSRPSHEPEEEE